MRLPRLLSRWFSSGQARTKAQSIGAWGEDLAAGHLQNRGYRLLGRNVRFGSRCELDLVARSPDGGTLVFVEVKTRKDEQFGRPISAVNRQKRRSLGRAAMRYLRRIKSHPARIRFDVIEVIGQPGSSADPVIRHVESAFSPGPGYRLPY